MSNTFKINIDTLQQDGLRELFASLERAFTAVNIDFYIVGAVARDIWLSSKGIKTRGTKDVDFAVYIPAKEDYVRLKQFLEEKEGFRSSTNNEFVMFSPRGLEVDLLPFGEIEVEGKIMIPGSGLTQIAVNGFREVHESAVISVDFEDGHIFKVCTLAGIVVLKLIAHDDRPEVRQKDIKDITQILEHYFDIESENIYEHHHDLFEGDWETQVVAARVLGRQMKEIFIGSPELEKRITSILEREIEDSEKSKICELMVEGTDNSINHAITLLQETLNGVNDMAKEN